MELRNKVISARHHVTARVTSAVPPHSRSGTLKIIQDLRGAMIKSWLTHGLLRKSKTGQMVAPMTRTLGETVEGERHE